MDAESYLTFYSSAGYMVCQTPRIYSSVLSLRQDCFFEIRWKKEKFFFLKKKEEREREREKRQEEN